MKTHNQTLPTIISALLTLSCFGQDAKPDAKEKEPKTKLEAFQAKVGRTVIQGYTRVGSVRGSLNTKAEVECKEFTDASSGAKEYGITITAKSSGPIDREATSFVDYDEIDSLVIGIEYIARVDKSTTKFADFQADYSTKDRLIVSTFSKSKGSTEAAVQCGRFNTTMAYLSLSNLDELKKLIVKAKGLIDEARK